MEIERQFLITEFPALPEIYRAQVWQGYLSTAPVVRIRRFSPPDGCDRYELTVKGKGTLVRAEVNIPIDAAQYEEMSGILRREGSCMPRWNLTRWRRRMPLFLRHSSAGK